MKYKFFAKNQSTIVDTISEGVPISKAAIKKLLAAGEVRLFGDKIFMDKPLSFGDEISVFVPQKFLPSISPKIVFSDESTAICYKPPFFDVENNLTQYIKEFYPHAVPVHRLDKKTEGLVIFAKSPEVEAALLQSIKDHKIQKFYKARVQGRLQKQGELVAFLKKDATKGEVQISSKPKQGYKKIITDIQIVATGKDYTDLIIRLVTGRTHQIRAFMAFLGCPVLGDTKYGKHSNVNIADDGSKLPFYALCAFKIVFGVMPAPIEHLSGKVFESSST